MSPRDPQGAETRTLESLARDGIVVSLSDVGASLPARPCTNTLTIPLNVLGETAELRLPKGVTSNELRLIVRYIETLLLADYVPTEYTDSTNTPRIPCAGEEQTNGT